MAQDKCDKITFYAPSGKLATKPEQACSPDYQPNWQELTERTGRLSETTALMTPRALVLGNEKFSADCSIFENGSEGDYVIVSPFTFTAIIPFSIISDIADDVLDYIARNNVVEELEELIKAGTISVERIIELAKLQPSQAAILYEAIVDTQEKLALNTRTLLESQLVCLWYNTAQTAQCSDPEMAHSYDNAEAVYQVTVPDRTISSAVSQEEADRLALTQAESQLNCFYISDPVTITCLTRPGAPPDVTEPVPNDPGVIYEGLSPRVGSVSLDKGAFVSYYSKEDANSQALSAAVSMLNCYYINDSYYTQCEDPNARGLGIDPAKEPAVDAIPSLRRQGQRVSIPAGFIVSQLSTADANEQAALLAESLLVCCFISPEMDVSCPAIPKVDVYGNPIYDDNGNPVMIPASETQSPVYSYKLEAGAFTSCVSQEEATRQAQELIDSVLNCYYCNVVVVPSCVPDWVVNAALYGIYVEVSFTTPSGKSYNVGDLYKLELPLKIGDIVNPYTGEAANLYEWSTDASVGVAADTFCGSSYIEVQKLADQVASTQLRASELATSLANCTIGNDAQVFGCDYTYGIQADWVTNYIEPVISYNTGAVLPTKALTSTVVVLDKNGRKVYVHKFGLGAKYVNGVPLPNPGGYPDTKPIAAYPPPAEVCVPRKGRYIEFSADLIQVPLSDVPGVEDLDGTTGITTSLLEQAKEYANRVAMTMVQSLVYCPFANPPTLVACDYKEDIRSSSRYVPLPWTAKNNGSSPGEPYWYIGAGKSSIYNSYLSPSSPSSARPIKIAEHTFTDVSFAAVLEKTRALATSLLICEYGNEEVSCSSSGGSCPNCDPEYVEVLLDSSSSSKMKIEKNTIYASSVAIATNLAKSICNVSSMQACLYGNLEQTCDCGSWFSSMSTVSSGAESPWGSDAIDLIPSIPGLSSVGNAVLARSTFVNSNCQLVADLTKAALKIDNIGTLCSQMCVSLSWSIMSNGEFECSCCDETKSRIIWGATGFNTVPVKLANVTANTGECLKFTIPRGTFRGNRKTLRAMLETQCIFLCDAFSKLGGGGGKSMPFDVVVSSTGESGGATTYTIRGGRIFLPEQKILEVGDSTGEVPGGGSGYLLLKVAQSGKGKCTVSYEIGPLPGNVEYVVPS